MSETEAPLFGVSAEFATEADLAEAAALAHQRGFGRVDAFAPMPVRHIAGVHSGRPRMLYIVSLAAMALGLAGFFGMNMFATVAGYRFIIGGRPLNSWPYYVVPSVSIGALTGAVGATLCMLFLNRLPRLNHPAFNIDGFERASVDRFFLTVEAQDETFDPGAVEDFLRARAPGLLGLQRVPR